MSMQIAKLHNATIHRVFGARVRRPHDATLNRIQGLASMSQSSELTHQQVAPSPKDAHISKNICRIMESQIWGPNTEPLLKSYSSDLSPDVVARVVLNQKSLSMATHFFRWSGHVRPHDSYAYHALLIKLGEGGQFDAMWQLLYEMRDMRCEVNRTTFCILLKAYGAAGLPHKALHAVERAHEFNVSLDAHIYTSLLGVLFKGKMLAQVKSVYKRMQGESLGFDGSVWSTLIRGFSKNGMIIEAERCWEAMICSGTEPTLIHYNVLIEGLCENNHLNKALVVLNALKAKGISPNAYTFNPILPAMCKVGRFDEAFSFFMDMKQSCNPNQATFNLLLEGLFLNKDVSKGMELYNSLDSKGWADSRTYFLVASALRRANKLDELMSVSEQLHVKNGIVNVWLCNALLHCLCHQQDSTKAVSYFDEMLKGLTHPDVVSFGTMISGYCKAGKVDDAMKLLYSMEGKGFTPNSFCYSPLISAALKAGRVMDGLLLFKDMLSKGIEPNAVTCDFLLRKLSEASMVDESISLCNHIIDRCFILHRPTLTSLLECLNNAGRLGKAKAVVEALQKQGCLAQSNT